MDESVKAIYDDLLKKSKAELRGLIGQLESTDAYENLYTNLWKKFTRKEATLKDKENLLKALAQAIYDYKPLEEEDNYESPTAEELEELKRKAKEEIDRLKPKPKPRTPSPPQPPKPRTPSPPQPPKPRTRTPPQPPKPRTPPRAPSKSPTHDCDSWIMKTKKKAGDVDFADILFVCGQKELSFEKFTKSVLDKDKVSPYIMNGVETRTVYITSDESGNKYWLIYSKNQKELKFVLTRGKEREKLDVINKFLSDYLKNNNLCPIKKVDGKFTFLAKMEVLPKSKSPKTSPKTSPKEPTEEEKKEEKRKKKVTEYLNLLMKKDITACDEDSPCADDKYMCDVEEKKCMEKSYAKYKPYGKDTKVLDYNGHVYIGTKDTIEALEKTLKAKKPKEPESEDEPEDEPDDDDGDDDVDVDLNLDDDIDIENLTALQKELFDCLMKGGSP